MEWLVFDAHASVVAGIALAAAAYAVGVGPLRRARGWADRAPRARIAAFSGGLAVILLALNGPLHALSDRYLLSAHMVQHLLLTLVAAPLLLAGTPGWLARPLLRLPRLGRSVRTLTRPPVAFVVYNLVLVAWHLPVLYEWAMRDHGLHVVQHLMFVAAALLLWWPVAGPVREPAALSPPAQILYLFLAGVPMTLVAALITLADRPLYPFYEEAPRLWGLSALGDQRIGGVIMWVPGSLVFLVAITIVFFRWARTEAEPVAAPTRAPEEAPYGNL
jgi:putative membrane protein